MLILLFGTDTAFTISLDGTRKQNIIPDKKKAKRRHNTAQQHNIHVTMIYWGHEENVAISSWIMQRQRKEDENMKRFIMVNGDNITTDITARCVQVSPVNWRALRVSTNLAFLIEYKFHQIFIWREESVNKIRWPLGRSFFISV